MLRARQRARPAFLHTGTLLERPVQRGDRVTAGERLALLHSPALAPTVTAARQRVAEFDARIEQLERDLARTRALHARKLASPDQLDRARAELDATGRAREQARAQLTQARAQLDELVLRAPFDGRIVTVMAEPGDFVAAGAPVLELAGERGLEVEIHLPAALEGRVGEGDPVKMTRPLQGGQFEGVIAHVGRGGARMASVLVRVVPDPRLHAGQAVHLHLQPDGPDRNLLQLPLSAIVDPGGQSPHVFRLVETEGRFHVQRIAVEPGRLGAKWVAVAASAGLGEGDRVVVAGQGGLTDGQPVRVLP